MSRSSRLCLALAVVAVSAAGCAPVTFAPGMGFGLSVGPSLRPNFSSCALLGQSSLASRLGLTAPSIQIGELRNRVAAIQSEYSLSANAPGSEMRGWKQVATGSCY